MGWDILKTRREKSNVSQKLDQIINDLNRKTIKVGWLSRNTYPDSSETVASVAIKNEYGFGVPARPFFRPSIDKYSDKWMDQLHKGISQVVKGNASVNTVYEGVGAIAADNVRSAIDTPLVPWLPLSPVTIAIRLSKRSNKSVVGNLTKPLIDTGQMYGTLTHAVE
jgi:hypothetical protein